MVASGPIPASTASGLAVLVDATEREPGFGNVTITQPNGSYIGHLNFEHFSGEWHQVRDVYVTNNFQRMGVATLMYDWVEDKLGRKLLPSDDQTEDAAGFWTNRKHGQTMAACR